MVANIELIEDSIFRGNITVWVIWIRLYSSTPAFQLGMRSVGATQPAVSKPCLASQYIIYDASRLEHNFSHNKLRLQQLPYCWTVIAIICWCLFPNFMGSCWLLGKRAFALHADMKFQLSGIANNWLVKQ